MFVTFCNCKLIFYLHLANKKMSKFKTKYLYVVLEWGGEPVSFRTKSDLVFYLGKKNSRIVDSWFEKNWYYLVDDKFIVRAEIPKIKSKIRNK